MSTSNDFSNISPLTVAYVAIGGSKALQEDQSSINKLNPEKFDGELGFLESVLDHIPELEAMAADQEFTGVFLYDVAEPFGFAVAKQLIEVGVSSEFIRRLAESLIKDVAK